MEATWNRSQVEQIVVGVSFIVIQDNDLVLEHGLYVFFCVKIEPVL